MLLSCDDLINLLFPNRMVTCSSSTEVGRQEKAYTGHREEQKKGRPQTLHEIQKRAGNCNADAEMQRKTKPDTWTATRNEAHMCRKTKAGLKEELINEFPETLNDKPNEQPMRSGEPMHIHPQNNSTKTSCQEIQAHRKHHPQ